VRHARTGLPKLIADDIVGKTLRLFYGQRHQPVLAYGEAADALNLLPLRRYSRHGRTCRWVARVAIDPQPTPKALRELTSLLHVVNSAFSFVALDCFVLITTTATPVPTK